MIGWHQRFNMSWKIRHEFEQTPEDSEGQGNLECRSLCSCKESDITERLNTNNKNFKAKDIFKNLFSYRSLVFRRPLDCKEIQPVHPQGNQSRVFIGRTDFEDETPILWPPDAKNWLIWKGPDSGKDWRQEEKGMTEDEMAGWHHRLNGHESAWTLGVGDGQGSLACWGSWGNKESVMTEQLN